MICLISEEECIRGDSNIPIKPEIFLGKIPKVCNSRSYPILKK